MHGRPRQPPKALTAEEVAKIEKYNKHKNAALVAHKKKVYNETTYALTGGLLPINPDFYTIFNFRKEIVLDMIAKDPSQKEKLLKAELDLMDKTLLNQPKSYYAWYHRVWVLEQGGADLSHELELCAKFHDMDPRNFHCWNYRREIAERALDKGIVSLEQELEYTTKRIQQNFSNYSAWHYRSVLIPRIHTAHMTALRMSSSEGKSETEDGTPDVDVDASGTAAAAATAWGELIDKEFSLVTQAIAMEPDDQSTWLYHRWLLAQVVSTPSGEGLSSTSPAAALLPSTYTSPAPTSTSRNSALRAPKLSFEKQRSVVARELEFLEDRMLVVEPDSRWVLSSIALLRALAQQLTAASQDSASIVPDDKIVSTLKRLTEIDAGRGNYYAHVLTKLTQGQQHENGSQQQKQDIS